MPSTCPGAPPLPSALTITLKNAQDMNPLELFILRFEPSVIDSPHHSQFRPALHEALEYYSKNRARMFVQVPAEDTRVQIADEHEAGLDG
jgi:hypothetical protein